MMRRITGPKVLRRWSTTDFGFKTVNKEEKEHLVKDVFTKVAQKYDIMNDLMSLGIHRLWKDEFVRMMGLQSLKSFQLAAIPRHLDVAGGTGDIAFRSCEHLVEAAPQLLEKNVFQAPSIPDHDRPIVVCDINPDMLAIGKDRAPKSLGPVNSKMVKVVLLTNTHAQLCKQHISL